MSDLNIPSVGDTVYCVREGNDGRPVGVAKMTVRDLPQFGNTFRADDGDPANPSLETNGYKMSAWLSFVDVASINRAYRTREDAWEAVRKAVTK